MIDSEFRGFLLIGLFLLISSTGIVWGMQAFADSHCDKNDHKKCNHSEKNHKSTSKDHVITINPTSGPAASLVTVTGNGFDPLSPVDISFNGDTRGTVIPNSTGGYGAIFNVPSTSSNGEYIVKASQESNSVSKKFKVTDVVDLKASQESSSSSDTVTNTSSLAPAITLNTTSGPIGSSIDITGAGFDRKSNVAITFNDTDIATTPTKVTTSKEGEFSANFIVPLTSSVGFVQIVVTQGSNSASETFIVTSSLDATGQSNVTETTGQSNVTETTGQSNVTETTGQSNVTETAPSTPNLSEKMILPNIFP